jgi:hypothetical protein
VEIVINVLLIRSTCYVSFKNYMDYLSRLFEVAKIKMTGMTKESKKFGKLRHGSSLSSCKNSFIYDF